MEFNTKIGLEIHVQLKTKSKMFCGCNNNAEGAEPNTLVCPVCLGLPGTLPVANKQAILWTIKTGLALNCGINKIAKFDRKHYFYPDLPKGYQISQFDQPFCTGGTIIIDGREVRINRIHLEEDAGKLIHKGEISLVDLNRAGTPLMEIVTEPDIVSPKQAGDFLRYLQKVVRDLVGVSDADMEKGHLRCDANISINTDGKMSEIVELKNINSFKFIEKALTIEEGRLSAKYPDWPVEVTKETRGYNSNDNTTYLQRKKEESADYRYFPEPDLPPFDSSEFDLESLRLEINSTEDEQIKILTDLGLSESDAKIILLDKIKNKFFNELLNILTGNQIVVASKSIVNNYFGFSLSLDDLDKINSYAKIIIALSENLINKNKFSEIAIKISEGQIIDEQVADILSKTENNIDEVEVEKIIEKVLSNNVSMVEAYKNGKVQVMGFLIGQVMKESAGKASPQNVTKIIKDKLS